MSSPTAVVSGEGVAFDLPRAGVGSRTVATVIDLALQFFAIFALTLIDTVFVGGSTDTAGATAVLIVELVLVIAGYPIICEWLTRGRTLGKLWLGLRVVRDDGGPIAFRHALVRGLSSLILEKPGIVAPGVGAAAGLMTAAFSSQDKRIGDMLAGTFVLNERAGTTRRLVAHDYVVPYGLQGWAAALDLSRLDDRLALGVRQFLGRAAAMTPAAQHALGEDLRARVLSVISPPPPPNTPTPWLLAAVLGERRRRTDLQARGWAPAGPLPPAAWPPVPPTAWPPVPPAVPPPRAPEAPGDSPFAPPG
jgi:uncharacterized RDD family membrane protein YckC